MSPIKAVLTADIVNSSLLTQKQFDDLLFVLKTELKQQKAKNDFYRGDSFHALCEAGEAFTLALRLRTLAKQSEWSTGSSETDIRIAIGIGSVEEPVKNMATAKGDAFTLSGRELDKLDKTEVRLSMRCNDQKADAGLEGLGVLADLLLRQMTAKQAEAVYELLSGATQIEAARKLKKSQPTINKLAQSASWPELEKAITIYHKLVSLITG